MMGLTQRQRECLDFIRTEVREKGISPSYDEIRVALDFKFKGGVFRLVNALVERGLLRQRIKTRIMDGKQFTANRGIELVESEYNHGADCLCFRCPARGIHYQQIVQALQVAPELRPGIRLDGLRIVPHTTRLYWQRGFPRSQKPVPQNLPAQAR